jgi:hypothetical protein
VVAAAVAAEVQSAAQPMMTVRPAAMVAAAVFAAASLAAARLAGRLARNLLLHGVANHPAAGDRFLVRDAVDHRTGRLAGDHPVDHAGVRLRTAFRHALADGDLALLFTDLVLVASDLASDRPALANALVAGDRAFFPGGARHPATHGLGADAFLFALIALAAAAMTMAMEAAAEAFAPARAAGHFAALIVAAIHAAANHVGHRLAGDVRLHDGPLFNRRHADADLADYGLDFRDGLVHRASARAGFGNALAAIGGVRLLFTLAGVNGPGRGVVFGHPLIDAHGAVLRGAGGGTAIISASSQCRRSHDAASQQGNANMLPDHVVSFEDATLADPGRHRDTPLGRTGQP